jgi:hypothetical protein
MTGTECEFQFSESTKYNNTGKRRDTILIVKTVFNHSGEVN